MAGGIRDNQGDDLPDNHEINVTPFIDVMLVLLIIFMVAAPLATVDVNVDLPVSNAPQAERPPQPVYVSVRPDLSLTVGDADVAPGALAAALDAATRGDPEQRIFLRADRSVAYGDLMGVMNTLRNTGYVQIALVGLDAVAAPPGALAAPAGGGTLSGSLTQGLRDGVVWIGASGLVLSAHLAAAAWILNHDDAGAPEGPSAPVFVDLVPPNPDPGPGTAPAQGSPEPDPSTVEPDEPVADMAETPPPLPSEPEIALDPEPQVGPLPEPEPEPELTSADLPDLLTLPPPVIPVQALVLEHSSRPVRRPAPGREPEPEAVRRAEPASQGQEGSATQAPQAGRASGTGGASAAQRASAMNEWGAQIRNCISRRAVAPRGIGQGGRVTLSLTVARSGAIESLGVAGSSGQPALDQAAVGAAQRAGRCPGAPAALDQARYSFQLPINLDVR